MVFLFSFLFFEVMRFLFLLFEIIILDPPYVYASGPAEWTICSSHTLSLSYASEPVLSTDVEISKDFFKYLISH